jgi:hypothetical protein
MLIGERKTENGERRSATPGICLEGICLFIIAICIAVVEYQKDTEKYDILG